MTKTAITRLFIGSLVAILAGLVLGFIAVMLAFTSGTFVMDGPDVAGIVSNPLAWTMIGLMPTASMKQTSMTRLARVRGSSMIEPPTSGSLQISGNEIVGASSETLRSLRSKVQIVSQNPYGSLNPRQKIGHALEEPLLVNTTLSAKERTERALQGLVAAAEPVMIVCFGGIVGFVALSLLQAIYSINAGAIR